MKSDPNRLVPAAQAQDRLPGLLDAATAGRATHIVRDQNVVAHLVCADALVLGADIEQLLLGVAVRAEAAWFAGEIEQGGYHHAGNAIGRILGWLWESSTPGGSARLDAGEAKLGPPHEPGGSARLDAGEAKLGPPHEPGDSAIRWLAHYAAELTGALAARKISRPPFDPFWKAVRMALDIDGPDTAVDDFEQTARDRLPEFTDLFTTSELAGHGRNREAGDPWPDTTATGRCFAKKRWRDVRVSDFVPAHPGADLGYDDGWCRVERFDAGEAVLRDADGQQLTSPVPDSTAWLPTRGREPWQWGMPR